MKIALICLVIFAAFLNFSCQQSVESSSITPNEKVQETPQPSQSPEKYEEIGIIDQFSRMKNENLPTLLEFKDYKINAFTVKKMCGGIDPPGTDTFDAVLSKNGKTITRYKGECNPLGNYISFGLFPFLGKTEKQLIVFDESYKYERDWIISLTTKYEVLFDSKDYGIGWGRLGVVDIDSDGIYELTEYQPFDLDLGLSNMNTPWGRVVFKYDSKSRKYFPANHIFRDYCLKNIDEEVEEYKQAEGKGIKELLEIMMTYIYAGKENEAWKFYDENFSPKDTFSVRIRDKEETRTTIKSALKKDLIYKFMKADIKKRN